MDNVVALLWLLLIALPFIYFFKRRSQKKQFQAALGRLLQEGKIKPDKVFIWGLGALAIDLTHQVVFLGSVEGGVRSKLYPIADVFKYQAGTDVVGNNPKHYLEITVDDIERPNWRLWFGKDDRLVTEVVGALEVAWRRR